MVQSASTTAKNKYSYPICKCTLWSFTNDWTCGIGRVGASDVGASAVIFKFSASYMNDIIHVLTDLSQAVF